MKRLFTLLTAVIIAATVYSQAPSKFSYQAVIRNSGGALVQSQAVGIKISILQGSAAGSTVYAETHTLTTNSNGLATLEIGSGSAFSGNFGTIDWSNGPYFLLTETDPAGGTSYTISGTSELLSVPYALYAKNAETADYNNLSNLPVLFNGAYSSLTGTPLIPTTTSQLTNNSGFLTSYTETDPLFSASQAANITAADITDLSNLSGVNTGDQNLSGLATTAAVTALLDTKVDKVAGKGLSTEDYSTVEKAKLSAIADGAEVNVNADWNAISGDAFIQNKPTIPTTTGELTNNSGFITSYSETDPVFSGLINITSPANNQLLRYNSVSGKWENWTSDFLTGFTETDPIWTSASLNYYTKSQTDVLIAGHAHSDATTTVSGFMSGTDKTKLDGLTNADGSETKVTSGTNVSVTGSGTTGSPYIINAAGSNGWNLTGNSGTSASTNFIGTTNEEALNIRVYNQPVLHFSTDKKFGFNTTTPSQLLHIRDIEIPANALDDDMDGNVDESGDQLVFTNYGRLGINTTAPEANLHVSGTVKITDGTQGAGKVLTSDANGMASWQAAGGGGGWSLTGNAGTSSGTNYIGTTDNQGFDIRTNNQIRTRITTKGQIEILNTGQSVFIGEGAGANDDLTNNYNVFIGYLSGTSNTSGFFNTAAGHQSLLSNIGGMFNTANGYKSLLSNTSGNENTAVGAEALSANSTGVSNTAIGYRSLMSNLGGHNNVAAGNGALASNIGGFQNIAIGPNALGLNTSGYQNTAIGYQSGFTSDFNNANVSGYQNTFIGYNSGPGTSTQLNNATAIGYGALVNVNNVIQLGNSSVTQVYAGTGNTATLIAGGLKITGGTPAAGKVLTSDATGVATWQTAGGGSGWSLTGNSGTVEGTNFIGTTDNIPLNFRVNNQKAGRIDGAQQVTFYGYQAGNSNSTSTNSAFGYQALYTNTSGANNTAIGRMSMMYNTTGGSNTVMGNLALLSNTTGDNNIAIGDNSAVSNSTGRYNIAIGSFALNSNWVGSYATAIGARAMYYSNSTMTPFTNFNVAVGFEALRGSTNAAANTGNANTVVGYQSMLSNTTGVDNTASGFSSLFSNTTGNLNTSYGSVALYSNATGSRNTAIGNSALINATMNDNTALGRSAGSNITIGSNNIAIGSNAQVPTPNASNQVRIGDANITYAGIQVAWTVTSDKRLKSDIQESNLGLDFITSLKPVSYSRINDVSNKREYGLIAQDLEESLNRSGVTNNGIIAQDDEGMYSVRYNDLLAPMIKAIQEQQQLIKSLQAEIGQLKGQNEQKLSILTKLEVENAAIKSDLENRLKVLEDLIAKTAQK